MGRAVEVVGWIATDDAPCESWANGNEDLGAGLQQSILPRVVVSGVFVEEIVVWLAAVGVVQVVHDHARATVVDVAGGEDGWLRAVPAEGPCRLVKVVVL